MVERFDEVLCIVESSTPKSRSIFAPGGWAWISIHDENGSHSSYQTSDPNCDPKSIVGEMCNVRPE